MHFRPHKRFLWFLLLFCLTAAFFSYGSDQILQAQEESFWSEPVNLSQAGSSTDPRLFEWTDGTVQVLWFDQFSGYVSTQGDGFTWSAPKSFYLPVFAHLDPPDVLPRGGSYPMVDLVADDGGRVQAVWQDSESRILHSWTDEFDTAVPESWAPAQILAESAVTQDIVLDGQNSLHLLYVQSHDAEDSPTGVFYRRSVDRGESWEEPILLFSSPYYRSISKSEAHVDLTIFADSQISASFDNRLQGRVYQALSNNGGRSWGEAELVDGRQAEDSVDSESPHSIQTAESPGAHHRYWLAGHDIEECGLYGQTRAVGEEWLPVERFFPDLEGCPKAFKLVNDPSGNLLIFIDADSTLYISSFSGGEWSELLPQQEVVAFQDPETFLQVELGCLEPVVVESPQSGIEFGILVVGCSESGSADIWARTLMVPEAVEAEPEPESAWSPILPISDRATDPRNPLTVTDVDGFLHTFWIGVEDGDSEAVYYSRYDGQRWSIPSAVLASSSGSSVEDYEVEVDALGRFAAVWGGKQPGDIYFSQAPTSRAALMSEWLVPFAIPALSPFATEPDLVISPANVFYIAYAVPSNENRGVHLDISRDGGATWSEPLVVFDAVEAGWQSVGQPRITLGDGAIHAIWSERTLAPDDQAVSLHYSRSLDDGLTWTEPLEVTSQAIGSSVVASTGGGSVHIIWKDGNGTIWHQNSSDSGASWTRAIRLDSQQGQGPIDVVMDSARRLHLLSLVGSLGFGDTDDDPAAYLKHWIWDGERWESGEILEIPNGDVNRGLSGTINLGGILSTIFASNLAEDSEQLPVMYYSSQQLEVPIAQPTPPPPITPTSTPLPLPTQTPQPTPTARTDFSPEEDSGSQFPIPVDSSSPLSSSLLGIIPAGLVVLIVFFVGIRMLRRDRH